MSVECQVNSKSQSELDIGGRETCLVRNVVTIQKEVNFLKIQLSDLPKDIFG